MFTICFSVPKFWILSTYFIITCLLTPEYNNGFWIGWFDLLTPSCTISLNHNQLQEFAINLTRNLLPWLQRTRPVLVLVLRLTSESNSKLCYDRRSVGQSVLVLSTHLGLKTRFLFLSDRSRFVDVGRPLWLGDGSAVHNCCWSCQRVILGSESCGTHDHILLSQVWDSPDLESQVPVLYPPGTGWPSYTPRH
jgi:hypothetical protein